MTKAGRSEKIRLQLRDELPDLILQNKDNPETLTQTLCSRAKQIEAEMKVEVKK